MSAAEVALCRRFANSDVVRFPKRVPVFSDVGSTFQTFTACCMLLLRGRLKLIFIAGLAAGFDAVLALCCAGHKPDRQCGGAAPAFGFGPFAKSVSEWSFQKPAWFGMMPAFAECSQKL